MFSHIDIDIDQELIKNDPQKPASFISFCDTKGMCYSMKSLEPYMNESQQENAFNFQAAKNVLQNQKRRYYNDSISEIEDSESDSLNLEAHNDSVHEYENDYERRMSKKYRMEDV